MSCLSLPANKTNSIEYLMANRLYFITKNYQSPRSAASKAKIDCEDVLKNVGFKNIGLPRTIIPNALISFFLTLFSVVIGILRLKTHSTICIQYPLKKYYNFIVKIAQLKKCNIITIIHDLRSLRKSKISTYNEITSLNRNSTIISHNKKMSLWLKKNGLTSNLNELEIFDYLGYSEEKIINYPANKSFNIVYAGVLAESKNAFIYDLQKLKSNYFKFNLYGVGFNKLKQRSKSNLNYYGSFPADKIINSIDGHFGLVWDGDSIDKCSGSFGEYLKINNPHKTSLYLRAGLPIIIWDKAAISDFIITNNIGVAISSLEELDYNLKNISVNEYKTMQMNCLNIGKKLGNGNFLNKVIKQHI